MREVYLLTAAREDQLAYSIAVQKWLESRDDAVGFWEGWRSYEEQDSVG